MTYTVPDWDDASNALTAFDPTFPPCQLKKGGTHLHQHPSQLADLQQHHHSVLRTNFASALVPIASDDMLDSVTLPGMQRYDGPKSSNRLGSSAIPAPNPPLPLSNACVHEDEMLSWLRYPLEDSFDRNYCSDMFGELINPHVQLVKDVFLHQSMKDSEISHIPISEDNVGSDVVSQETKYAAVATGSSRKGIKTDAAMALGAGRAAGVLSLAGAEAFSGVRTHLTPCGILKPSSSPLKKPSSDDNTTDQVSNTLAPVLATSSAYNFSLFSRPLATTMDNLHFVGVASGPTNTERARQPLLKESPPPCNPCTVDSNGRISVNISAFQQLADYNPQRRVESAGKVCRDWCSSPSVPHEPFSLSHTETAELNSRVSCVSFSGTALEPLEAVEAVASPTCLSGSSVEKVAEEVVTISKKSTSTAQLSEQQDVEGFPANARKPPPGPRAGKRSRAAEVHNESEKKRRNKINVRLKLLQSLIPNSNKTDKASVLDEAIEYTKMLQAQLQFMSTKAGMFFPTMVHAGMQYVVPMEQLPTVSHLGVGMGMPFGVHVDTGFGLPVSGANAANMRGSGGGIVAATCAGAGNGLSVLPTMHQPFSHSCAGSQLVQKRSCSPIYDISSGMSVASAPLQVAMTQQLPQGLMNVHMNANLYSASQQ